MSVLDELKRRNVFRIGIAYVVVSWLILQIADVLLNNIEAPGWVFQVILLLLGIGLPLALLFAWAFELTPEGLKRERDVDRTQSVTPKTGKKLDRVIFVVMALALGYFVYDKFVLSASRDAALVEATTQAMTEQATTASKGTAESDKSIAVLPFADMSQNKDEDYFSDGLSEDLLNLLAKIPQLKVAARTSSFQFKGQTGDIADIGKQLKVAHLLEGSVRTAGNRVRVTAQLIQAETGYHLWSETYDRNLDDIFAIQDEIAGAVVAELKIKLLGEAPTMHETSPEAYALYLQARHLGRQGTPVSWEQSIALYEQALAIAPDYAAAWDGLAFDYLKQIGNGQLAFAEGYALARDAAEKALAIDPNFAAAYANLGAIAMRWDYDLAAAAQNYERALELEPTNLDILNGAAVLLRNLGRVQQAIAINEYIVARDPVYAAVRLTLGSNYTQAGRWNDAIASFQTALRLSPDIIGAHGAIGSLLLLRGELESALAEILREPFEVWRLMGLAKVYHTLGRMEDSDTALAELIETYHQEWALQIAQVFAFRNQADEAFAWLDKAVEFRDPGLMDIAAAFQLTNIPDDPRWLPFLESIGMLPAQLDAIKFEVALPH